MRSVKVVELIPFGHDNAVTLEELGRKVSMRERDIRNAIAKSSEIIINLQDGAGYFKPTKEETELVEIWLDQMNSRVRELSQRVRKTNKWLKGVNHAWNEV